MGQKIGRARIHDDAVPFCNLPRDDIYELWDRFNDIADGFGLNLEARIGTGRPHVAVASRRPSVCAGLVFAPRVPDTRQIVGRCVFLRRSRRFAPTSRGT